MRGRSTRTALVAALAIIVLLFAFVGSAYADFSYDLTTSPGEGTALGNFHPDTSPVPGGASAISFNKNFSVTAIYIDDVLGALPVDAASFSKNGAPAQPFSGALDVSEEGVYSISATAVVDVASIPTTFTGELGPYALDRTDPGTGSNAVPVYDVSAAITITATDALSGAEFIRYKLDGDPAYLQAPDEFGVLTASVVAGEGPHKLAWTTYDNAGNTAERTVSFTVLKAEYLPVLSNPVVKKLAHARFSFKGTVTPAATAKTVSLVVQRLRGGHYRSYKTFSVPVAKYIGSYSFTGSVGRHSTYRVKASQGAGLSTRWIGFKSN